MQAIPMVMPHTPPVAEIFCLCRAAQVSDGRLNISDAIIRVGVPAFPAHLPNLVLCARLRFALSDEGTHHFRVTATDLDGKQLGPSVEAKQSVTSERSDEHAWQYLIVDYGKFHLLKEDDLHFLLEVDGRQLASTWLCVRSQTN